MNGAFGNPGFHQAAETGRTTGWRAQQYFAASGYDTSMPAAFDWHCGREQVKLVTLSQNSTINFPLNARRGGTYILIIKQDATGSRTLAFTNQIAQYGSGTWKWSGGVAPTLTLTAAKIDVFTFVFDGTDMLGVSALNC